MSAVPKSVLAEKEAEELHNGDHLSRQEFHRLYEQTAEDFRAELIGGIVYVASPVGAQHAEFHPMLSAVFTAYAGNTPGVAVGDNGTVLLGEESEPQPDLYLRIVPECGGRSGIEGRYVSGPPELVAEIAHSSRAIDLHRKRDDYRRYGVLEYLVLSLKDSRLRWFDLSADREVFCGPDGIARVRTFPGLWVNAAALMRKDYRLLMDTAQLGLSAPEHGDFVQRLADAKKAH